jgi:hypothetical protein
MGERAQEGFRQRNNIIETIFQKNHSGHFVEDRLYGDKRASREASKEAVG